MTEADEVVFMPRMSGAGVCVGMRLCERLGARMFCVCVLWQVLLPDRPSRRWPKRRSRSLTPWARLTGALWTEG